MWSEWKKHKTLISVILLVIFNGVGIFGILLSDNPISFLSLTPLNLLISASILFANHLNWKSIQVIVFVIIAVLGFGVEVLGVKTGLIFGSYYYESVLGWKLFDVSLVIGLNWIMLSYFAVYSFAKYIKNTYVLSLVASVFLVGLDLLIEPVAIRYDFWEWNTPEIPVQNFVAWWCIALVFCFFIAKTIGESDNKVAPYLLSIQVLFFGILNILS